MAARTGIGVGLGVTVTVLGLTTLGLFVLTFIFMGDKKTAERQLAELKDQSKSVISDTEKNDDMIGRLVTAASADKKSVAAYLRDNIGTLKERLGGNKDETFPALLARIDSARGDSPSIIQAVMDRDGRIAQLDKAAKDSEAARAAANAKLQEQTEIVRRLEDSHKKTMDALNADVGNYKSEAEKYRAEVEKRVKEIEGLILGVKNESAGEIVALNDRLSKANEELAVANNRVAVLQQALGANRMRPADEAALIDGEVVGLDAASTDVYINRGRKHKIILGMTFSVYPSAGSIQIDDRTGEYVRGKATLEVIKVEDSSATCRVIRQVRGNPVTRGDVIANAVYDPSKQYVFMIAGNFDADGDARSTPEEAMQIRTLIEGWGGRVIDALAGDVDFVVLGARPVLPPQPRPEAGVGPMGVYLKAKEAVEAYDKLFAQASGGSIPILNQNRLRTLIGQD